jgi:hypothetical protein
LINTVKSIETWVQQNPSTTDIPRSIGEHDFTLGDTTEKCAIGTFHQWKVQRIIDCYRQFDRQQKLSIDTFLHSVGGFDSMQLDIKTRLSRVNNKLILSK